MFHPILSVYWIHQQAAKSFQSHQPFKRFPRLGWNHAIAQGSQTVYSLGYPMSHSTHVGFS